MVEPLPQLLVGCRIELSPQLGCTGCDRAIGRMMRTFSEANLATHMTQNDSEDLGPFIKPYPNAKEIATRTQLRSGAPAPVLGGMIAELGPEPTARALEAWEARVSGVPIIDVAHQMGVSI